MKRPRTQAPELVELEATIDELAPGGDGVAIAEIGGERRAVFVRGVAPGDRVRLAVDARPRPARGRVVSLVASGPDRVAAPCAYADRCGGCDWIHVSPEGQARAHAAQVRAALPHAWRDAIEVVSHAAPRSLAYRTRARLHVRASGGRAIAGIHEVGTHEPVEVDACAVLAPDLERARLRVGPLLDGAHGRGDVQLALGALDAIDGAPRPAVLDLRWSGALPPATFARLERARAGEGDEGWLQGARVFAGDTTKPAVIGDPTPWMRGADGAPLRLAPGGFGQASDEGNALLANRVAALAPPGLRVVELYAGAGNLSVLLARGAASLVAVEASRDACDAARANLAARGLTARVVEADAATYAIGGGAQLVVLDPPRTGAREVAARLAEDGPRHVIYVSCDAQTLGRDLAVLAARYAPKAIETFEMFPMTSHVETVVLLEKTRGKA